MKRSGNVLSAKVAESSVTPIMAFSMPSAAMFDRLLEGIAPEHIPDVSFGLNAALISTLTECSPALSPWMSR